jgi:hypothetical protein
MGIVADSIAAGKRVVAYIPPDAWKEGHGHEVSFVIENQGGHFTSGGDVAPWYWGDPKDAQKSFELAEKTAKEYNQRRGISNEDAIKIVLGSMFASR